MRKRDCAYMDVTIFPRKLRGAVTPPPSKSLAHRVVLAELLAGERTFSVPPSLSEDIGATIRCAEALQVPAHCEEALQPGEILRTETDKLPLLDCGESGSTLRFLLPAALVLRGGGVFTGHGRLLSRPMEPYRDLCRARGILYEQEGDRLTVRGCLTPGEYRLTGAVSSQFITGLLFALPLLDGASALRLTAPLESAAYVDLTLDVLERCGVTVLRPDGETFTIPGGQRYKAKDLPLEADWSQAAFWFAAKFLGNPVEIAGLNPRSVQGDRAILGLYRELSGSGPCEIDLSGIPDLLPPLAVMAAYRKNTTRFVNAGRLRFKESDRLESVCTLLRTFGVGAETGEDWLKVAGGLPNLRPPVTVDGAGDHRIVMAAAALASVWNAPVTIRGAEAVKKSYPSFFADYQQLGGEVHGL